MKRALMVVGMAVAMTVTPVSGQTTAPWNDALSRQALRNYAACAVKRASNGARDLLAMDYRTDGYRRALDRYARGNSGCMPRGKLKFGGILLAGGLAEALLPGALRGAPLATRIASAQGGDVSSARDELEAFGFCVVRSVPDAVAVVLQSEPGTPGETAAFKSTGPAIGNCVVEGKQMTVNKPLLRSLYALSAYRLVSKAGLAPEGH